MVWLKRSGHWLLTIYVAFVFIQSLFELIASVLLLAGAVIYRQRAIQVMGAAIGLGVISGAILFHLFTPLGVAVVNTDGSSDGGELFMPARGVWVACALLLWIRREVWMAWLTRLTSR